MKKNVILCLVLVLLFSLSVCVKSETDVQQDFIGTLGKQEIELQLKFVESESLMTSITGYCYIKESDTTSLMSRLLGIKDSENSLVIMDRDNLGRITGVFVGKLKGGSKIEGIWTNSDGSKQTPFILEKKFAAINFDGLWKGTNYDETGEVESRLTISLKQDGKKLSGYYYSEIYVLETDSYMCVDTFKWDTPPIEGIINGNTATLSIRGIDSKTSGKLMLIYDQDNMTWEVMKKADGEFYLPNKMKLLREQ
jgi:hypothetical protein